MTQENKRGELVGYPARESELESNNLKNTRVILSLITKTPNPIPTKNLIQNPTQSPSENPILNPMNKNPL